MKKLVLFFIISSFVFFNWAKEDLNYILQNPHLYHKKIVEIEGEVIGDKICFKGECWINIMSKDNNIGVFLEDNKMMENIRYLGSYKYRGDIVKVKGVFFNNCDVHKGTDIHAQSLEIVERGFTKREDISLLKLQILLISFIICFIICILYFFKVVYARRD